MPFSLIIKWNFIIQLYYKKIIPQLYIYNLNTWQKNKNYKKLIYKRKIPHFSAELSLTNNSQVTSNKYLYWVGDVQKHQNIMQTLLYYAGALTITSTKHLIFEEMFLNKFYKPYLSKTKNIYDIIFITSPYIDILKIRTKVKSKKLFTIQVAKQYNVLNHITLPFWVNTYNTWIEYFYVLLYYKNYVYISNYKYFLIRYFFCRQM